MTDMFKMWVYHATKKPKVINSDEFEVLSRLGWTDSPAQFMKLADFNIAPDDKAAIHQFGETIDGVKNAVNGALNIVTMSKKELQAYAKKFFAIDIDKQKTIKSLRDEVKEMAGV